MREEREKNAIVAGTLYLVATPIGNLSDISERALKVLNGVDFIAAEDTRNSGLMLSRLGISKPLVSYFEHNKKEKGPKIVERLKNGESCALITDAGTPAISDPGEDLVRMCADNGVNVTSIPGACAGITALTLSALSTRRFVFEGFLEGVTKERRKQIEGIKNERRTVILYEAPHRLKATLKELLDKIGDRKITVCREITKLNEEVLRTTLSGAVEHYENNEPRGEYVLVLEGNTEEEDSYPEDIKEHVDSLIEMGMDRMDAMKAAAKARGVSKSDIYREYSAK